MALRTGIVALVLLVKHICRLLATWRAPIGTVIAAAVAGGTITAGQATTLNAWLDGADAACTALRAITDY